MDSFLTRVFKVDSAINESKNKGDKNFGSKSDLMNVNVANGFNPRTRKDGGKLIK